MKFSFLISGGTSFGAPSMAGIRVALINQKTGQRQGNANYALYKLAQSAGASCTSNAVTAAASGTEHHLHVL